MDLKATSEAKRPAVDVFIGCFLPPLLVYRTFKTQKEFWICIILCFCFWFPGVIYAFTKNGMKFEISLLCCLLPPIGLYLSTKKCDLDIVICCLLSLTWFCGCWWALWKA